MTDNEEDTTLCKNCRRQIATSNFVLHEMHCKRNISLCEHCNEPIPKAEMEVHFEETHAEIPCPKCKMSVEKQHLEIHEEQECLKRPVKCHYCEMDVAKGELEEHLEYCGTRTENCLLCGQFIMVKDMARHEESKCSYGGVQPKNNSRNDLPRPIINKPPVSVATRMPPSPSADAADDFLFGSGELNSFQMDEIQRLLGASGQGASHQTRGIAGARPSVRPTPLAAISKSKKKEVNVQRKNRNGDVNHNMDHDQTFLPCEFCGEAFPVDILVLHQSSCTEDQLSSLADNHFSSVDNRVNYPMTPTERPIPNVIDNLHGYDIYDDSEPTEFTEGAGPVKLDENLLLPCEFCDELFPQDVLVLHQAVCDSDTLKTPRVMSPAVRNPGGAMRKVPNTSISKPASHTPNINEIIYGKDHVTPAGPHSRDLDHTLRKYGSSSFDAFGSRGQHGTSEIERSPPTSPRRSTSRSSVSSAARTRRTLNSLLSDYDSPVPTSKPGASRSDSRETAGSFVGFSSSRKANVNLNNLAKQTARSTPSSSRITGASSIRNETKRTNTGANHRDNFDPDLEVGNLRPSRSQRNPENRYLPTTPGGQSSRQRDRTFDYGDRTSKTRSPTKRRDQY